MGFTIAHKESYMRGLDASVKSTMGYKKAQAGPVVVNLEMVQKSNIYGYHGNNKALFLRIFVRLPSLIAGCKRVFKEGFQVQGLGLVTCSQTFESNIPFPLRYMIDSKIQGGSWIEIPPKSYDLRTENATTCQIELDVWCVLNQRFN